MVWAVADIVIVMAPRDSAEAPGPERSGPAHRPALLKDTEIEMASTGGGCIATMQGPTWRLTLWSKPAPPFPEVSGFSGDIKGLGRALDLEKAPFLLA
ncbi:hypothetical protein XH94_29875 [Bradyrhizobium zhanjiangense]|uniref:Uncharacterized protein n=1 Tax=Bradyrhizobium zhanjiangense TaxID=1325107 RepID=A0A4Q0SAT3_9BRAD|nr:hypothetical protein XH94_29875 [Bradyrhizobium zhanjiangense]